LVSEPPSKEAQRGLILISKLLQNIANEIELDDTSPAQHKAEMNAFVLENTGALRSFFNKLTVIN
jgi:hypothetical protein